jgi:hypothetical protein
MTASSNIQAFGGLYVTSTQAMTGTAKWNFTIPVSGDYVVWARVRASSSDHDSFYVKSDTTSEDIYDVAEGTWGPNWQWTRVNGEGGTGNPLTINPRIFSFTAGIHSIRFREREPGTRVDRILITNDMSFIPTEGNTNAFLDAPPSNPFYDFIENLARNMITSGCGGGNYCPTESITRAQMAVLLLKSKHGSGYNPPPATGTVFSDVPKTAFAAAWIERLKAEGISTGCGGGKYCPNAPVTRDQMAVFLMKASHGSGYVPPAATGIFDDVPTSNPFARWIEELYNEQITAGCGNNNFCPDAINTRAQMAAFLVRTFDLP